MATFFPWAPGVRTTGRKKVRMAMRQAGGLLPFPRTGCVLYAKVDGTGVGEGRQAGGGRRVYEEIGSKIPDSRFKDRKPWSHKHLK